MLAFIKKILNKSNLALIILALSTSVFLLRSNIPYAIYVYALLQTFLILNILKKNKLGIILDKLKFSLNHFFSYYLISVFFIIAFFFNSPEGGIYNDIINLLAYLSFIFIFLFEVRIWNEFYKYKKYILTSFVLLFSMYLVVYFIISLVNSDLSSFFFAVRGGQGNFDRNMYSLNLWITVIALFVLIREIKKKYVIIFVNVFIFLLLILVLFSSSRRGIVILVLFSISFIAYQLFVFFKRKDFFKKLNTLFYIYIVAFFLLIAIILLPANTRSQIFSNTINNVELKTDISLTFYRYYHLIKPESSFKEVKKLIWNDTKKVELLEYRKLLNTANVKYKEKQYTEAINLIQKVVLETDSIEKIFTILPVELQNIAPEKSKKAIQYFPELAKLPYRYTKFFSCLDIDNLFLQRLEHDSTQFPFVFTFKKNKAAINLTLPALALSEYKLSFQIKSRTNPVDTLKIGSNATLLEYVKNKQLNIFEYTYKVSVQDTPKSSLDLNIILEKNDLDSFAISDLSWELLNTHNQESPKLLYSAVKNELAKFKFEQNRSILLWRYYFNAEKLTDITGQQNYSKKEILDLFNKISLQMHAFSYVATNVFIQNKSNMVIYDAGSSFPRSKFSLPIIQKSTYQIEFEYFNNNTKTLITYFKQTPEIHNVYFKYGVLSDSIYSFSKKRFKKVVKFSVDSINSATAIFAFGFKNLIQNDTLIVSNVKFELLDIQTDSVLLSDTQYSFLKKWADRGSQNNHPQQNDQTQELNNEVKLYENEDYWQIDSAVYESAAADRFELWLFGWQYFKSLPLQNKLFGDGFKYNKLYKLKFGAKYGYNKNYSPHNPILSALLYSGILGSLVYIFFLVQVFYFYLKYWREFGVFSLLFVLIFIYSFISGMTHFSIPYFGMFSIFPFLYKYVKSIDDGSMKMDKVNN